MPDAAASLLATKRFFPNEAHGFPYMDNVERYFNIFGYLLFHELFSVSLAKSVRFHSEYSLAADSQRQQSIQVKPSVLFEFASRMNEPSLLQKIPESGPKAPTISCNVPENESRIYAPPAGSLALMPADLMKQKERESESSLGKYVRRGKLVHELPKPQSHPKWKLMRVISGHTGWVRSLSVDMSNEWFASGAGDRTIKVNCLF